MSIYYWVPQVGLEMLLEDLEAGRVPWLCIK